MSVPVFVVVEVVVAEVVGVVGVLTSTGATVILNVVVVWTGLPWSPVVRTLSVVYPAVTAVIVPS